MHPSASTHNMSPRQQTTIDAASSSAALATAPSASLPDNSTHPPSTPSVAVPSGASAAGSSTAASRLRSSNSLSPNPPQGGVKAAFSFVKRITKVRKQRPARAPGQQPDGDDDGDDHGDDGGGMVSPGADGGGAANQPPPPPPPVTLQAETIEPAVPGSMVAGVSLYDDTLDVLLSPPLLERSSSVADYVASAANWLMTDRMLEQHEEFVARGLLMIRNVVRSEPRYAAQASGQWLPVVRDSLGSKHGLVRSSAASALAAFAASTPGREAIRKDTLVLQRLMQMLTAGLLSGGGDNNDTQYSCLALSNIALNACSRQQLTRHGALQRAADVLRAAIRHFSNAAEAAAAALQHHQPHAITLACGGGSRGCRGAGGGSGGGAGGASGGGASGGGLHHHAGRTPASSLLKSATYMATMMTSWAVEPADREQLKRYDVPRLASELHGLCCASMGDDHPLSRRLALLADTSSAAQLLQEIAEAEDGAAMGQSNWEKGQEEHNIVGAHPHPHPHPHPAPLRGTSFVDGSSRSKSRVWAAINSLHRIVDSSDIGDGGGDGDSDAASTPRAPVGSVSKTASRKLLGTTSSLRLPLEGSLPVTSSISSSSATPAAATTVSGPTSPSPCPPAVATPTSTSTSPFRVAAATVTTTAAASSTADPAGPFPSPSPSPALLSPRDVATTTTSTSTSTSTGMSRLGKQPSGRVSQPGPSPRTPNLSLYLTTSASHPGSHTPPSPFSSSQPLTPSLSRRLEAFSDNGLHQPSPSSGMAASGTASQQQQPHLQQHLSQSLSLSQSQFHSHLQQQPSTSQSLSQQPQLLHRGSSTSVGSLGGDPRGDPCGVSLGGRSSTGLGVHFSASIFQEATQATAAASAAARVSGPGVHVGWFDEEAAGGQRRSASSLSQSPSVSSRSMRLPAVPSGGGSSIGGGARNSDGGSITNSRVAPVMDATALTPTRRSSLSNSPSVPARGGSFSVHTEQRPTGRLDLPFHLVLRTTTISASSSGKISRIAAAYGTVFNGRQPSSGTGSGSGHPLQGYPRAYTSEL